VLVRCVSCVGVVRGADRVVLGCESCVGVVRGADRVVLGCQSCVLVAITQCEDFATVMLLLIVWICMVKI
jgi:hypothetical protein